MTEALTSDMTPSLIIHPHALVGSGRIAETSPFRAKETLAAYIKRTGVTVPSGPLAIWHNGFRVPEDLWKRFIPKAGDQVIVRTRVQGGGGDSSKAIRTVAMIALSLSAPWIAGYALTGTWAAATGFSGALLTGAIMVGGSALITPLIPEIAQ